MLKRKIYSTLIDWKNNPNRKCLFVKGARQIGKTFIIREFLNNEYDNFIELNFITDASAKDIFESSLSYEEIMQRLNLKYQFSVKENKRNAIFLDEIQECPRARSAIKFLVDAKKIDVIASGSLLGVKYKLKDVPSVPVGYINSVEMYSLDFEEFLWALNIDDSVISYFKDRYEKLEKVDHDMNESMFKRLREYLIVGGMPDVVNEYIRSKDFVRIHRIQRDILDLYLDDIVKYAEKEDVNKIRAIYLSIPTQLAKENKKFKLSLVDKNARFNKYETPLYWLKDASLSFFNYNLKTIDFPFSVYQKLDEFKLYFSDVGLLSCLYGYEIKDMIFNNTLKGDAKGGIYENFVADALIKKDIPLYYYKKENSEIEIEFLIIKNGNIVPIEVKASNNRSISLDTILKTNDFNFGYKFITGNLGVKDKKITLPLYMVMFL